MAVSDGDLPQADAILLKSLIRHLSANSRTQMKQAFLSYHAHVQRQRSSTARDAVPNGKRIKVVHGCKSMCNISPYCHFIVLSCLLITSIRAGPTVLRTRPQFCTLPFGMMSTLHKNLEIKRRVQCAAWDVSLEHAGCYARPGRAPGPGAPPDTAETAGLVALLGWQAGWQTGLAGPPAAAL